MAEDAPQLTPIAEDASPTWPLAASGSADNTTAVKSNLQWLTLLVLVAAAGLVYLCLRLRKLRWWPRRQADIAPSGLLDIDGSWFIPPPAAQHHHPSLFHHLLFVEEPMPVHHRERQPAQQEYQEQSDLQQHQQQWAQAAIGRQHHRRRHHDRPRTPPPAYPDASSHPPPAYDDIGRSYQSFNSNAPYRHIRPIIDP